MHDNKLTAFVIDSNNFIPTKFKIIQVEFDPFEIYGKADALSYHEYSNRNWSDEKW